VFIENPFKYSGHISPKKHAYITRNKQIERVLNGIQRMVYYAVIAPRQTGKTTFMKHLINQISRDELHTHEGIYITLEDIRDVEKDKFYSYIARKITRSLENRYFIEPESFNSSYKKVQSNQDLEDFLAKLSKVTIFNKREDNLIMNNKERNLKYVICIDEIEGAKELASEFLWTIRAMHEQSDGYDDESGDFDKGFDRYCFIISGATALEELTSGKVSPFNIADSINLEDFEEEEITSMVKKALDKVMVHYYESFPHDIFYQTNGHPCLTQKLCSWILEGLMLEKRDYIREDDLTGNIDKLIDSADITLRTTLERVSGDENLDIVKRLLRGEKIRYNEYDTFSAKLRLAGAVVRDEDGFCKIRNPIYETFFANQFNL